LPFLFAVTLFVSATLLFLVQPMIAKMVLPLLGGTPAVWNTCMVFFQAALLAGYAYAHAISSWTRVRRQVLLHMVVLCVPIIALPIAIAGWNPPSELTDIRWLRWVPASWIPPNAIPILGLLGLLVASVGLPFFVLSTSAPLLQKWFANTGHPAGKDPYFLYAASNLGSMLALLGYPTLVEPFLPVKYYAQLSDDGKVNVWLSQSWLWAAGYGLFIVLTVICAQVVWKSCPRFASSGSEPDASDDGLDSKPGVLTRLRWIALAFVPSSLMLGVTTHITLDIAAIPLLWVIPLALYLLSFILVFAPGIRPRPTVAVLTCVLATLVVGVILYKPQEITEVPFLWALPLALYFLCLFLAYAMWPTGAYKASGLIMPLLVLLLVFLMQSAVSLNVSLRILLHLAVLFAVALVCHGELSQGRPSTRYLTQFYLLMSLGGVLGGLFNALVAPLVFNGIYEYPIAIACACLLVPPLSPGKRVWSSRWFPSRAGGLVGICLDILLAVILGFVTLGLLDFMGTSADEMRQGAKDHGWLAESIAGVVATLHGGLFKGLGRFEDWFNGKNFVVLGRGLQIDYVQIIKVIEYGLPALLCYTYISRPLRFGLAVGAFFVAGMYFDHVRGSQLLYQTRSFFGVMKVKYELAKSDDDEEEYPTYELVHGTTLHGRQIRTKELQSEPITYYHWTGPIGRMFDSFAKTGARKNVAVIGLGSGTMSAWRKSPDMRMTFYDIDPAVVGIATNPAYFTYFTDAKLDKNKDIVLGDARLRIAEAKPKEYDLIVADAFSSDAIPIHLITREAIQLYLQKLSDNGVLAVHVSNRYLDLEPVLGNIVKDLGLHALFQYDSQEKKWRGKTSSEWAVLAKNREALGDLVGDSRWRALEENPAIGVWTDDFSNLLGVFQWKN
jgi:hypothetical protein